MDPWRSQIGEWLRQGLSGVRMLELARDDAEQPFRGCDQVWRAAVRRERLVLDHQQAVVDVPIRFEGLRGEYLQVDWGEIRHFPLACCGGQRRVAEYLLTHGADINWVPDYARNTPRRWARIRGAMR